MENASKALLMAAGTLMALLTISLLVIMFNRVADTQKTSNLDSSNQVTIEFNNQFSSYNREDVRGSELYSCINRACDYNKRKTYVQDTENISDAAYTPMGIEINFSDRAQLQFDTSIPLQIFTGSREIYSFRNK